MEAVATRKLVVTVTAEVVVDDDRVLKEDVESAIIRYIAEHRSNEVRYGYPIDGPLRHIITVSLKYRNTYTDSRGNTLHSTDG